ncbi:MAG: hypothetical protein ACE5QW_04185 [Thermoplasmata archaeon]
MRNEGSNRNNEEKGNRVITVELEFSRKWSLQNSIPILKHLISEYQDFLKSAKAQDMPSRTGKDDAVQKLDDVNPPFTGAMPLAGDYFHNGRESKYEKRRPCDKEEVTQE